MQTLRSNGQNDFFQSGNARPAVPVNVDRTQRRSGHTW